MAQTSQRPPGLIISAPGRGHGKTLVTLGLLRALAQQGLTVSGVKCGVEFVWPALFWQASGRASFHLDSWAMAPDLIDLTTRFFTDKTQLIVCDGQLGLFDGLPLSRAKAPFGTATTADIASKTGWPVILVVDASGQSQSLAASLKGFVDFDPRINLAGIILNKVNSARHAAVLKEAIAPLNIPVFGCLPLTNDLHAELALLKPMLYAPQSKEFSQRLTQALDGFAKLISEALDLEALTRTANQAPHADKTIVRNFHASLVPPGQRIAIARDSAFSFIYPHVLEGWRWQGAEFIFFSPLKNEPPPSHCDACWLGGGAFEPYLSELANADQFFNGLRQFASHKPVHGEAAGFCVLGNSISDTHGHVYKMAGLLAHHSKINQQHSFGYRLLKLQTTSALGKRDMIMRGYEHHTYAVSPANTTTIDQSLGEVSDAYGAKFLPYGSQRGFVSATLCHMIGYG